MTDEQLVKDLRETPYTLDADAADRLTALKDQNGMLRAECEVIARSKRAVVDENAAWRGKYDELQRYNVSCTKKCDELNVQNAELKQQIDYDNAANLELYNENADLRNELCLKCGQYKQAHTGACDGCRWKEKAHDGV